MSEAIRKIYMPSDKWSARNCPIFSPACNDYGLDSQCLRKQLGVLGYPMGIILDNGQALAVICLSNRHLVGLHLIHHKKEILQFIWRFI